MDDTIDHTGGLGALVSVASKAQEIAETVPPISDQPEVLCSLTLTVALKRP